MKLFKGRESDDMTSRSGNQTNRERGSQTD
jgi:hypothetical protein